MPDDGGSHRNASQFNRMFNAEFLDVRKDITEAMLLTAKGEFDEVAKILKNDPFEIGKKNKDGNGLLQIAVANNQAAIVNLVLELKGEIGHKNSRQMDALDYATLDGVVNKMSKVILSHCDYLIPEVIAGPHRIVCQNNVAHLQSTGMVPVRSAILGKLPDFSDVFSKETEYRKEWTEAMLFVVNSVRKGVLLPSDSVSYLERDAMLTGCLEVPARKRYVYVKDKGIIRFDEALRKVYSKAIELRMIEASLQGEATAVQGLLRAKASANTRDVHGQTLLMRACHHTDYMTILCLLQAKANVNETSKNGYPPLMLAATRNSEKAVNLLLRAKADMKQKSFKGHNVFDFVKHAGHKNILKLLEGHEEEHPAQ
mmetsp:Transcript_106999/g.301012  ORF Transcript_106999/g.301012 Transcript_106999/m.301012 type:complete len:370 (+) Transcript_106999:110-1219(+)